MRPGELITLAQLGKLEAGGARNARNIANDHQGAFRFEWHPEPLTFKEEEYRFPNGALDLCRAAKDILAVKDLPRPLILLTSLPLSTREYAQDKDGLLFSASDFPDDSGIMVVSTHLWEQVSTQKKRLQPYFIFMLAGLALQFSAKLAYHEETRGCFFDSCETAEEILKAFEVANLCEDCERSLETRLRKGTLHVEQIASVKRLLNRAFGKKVCFMAMPFDDKMQSSYDGIAEALIKKGWTVVRADEIARPRRITDRIRQAILSSDLILADLTGNNPNVFYELGMAHAVGADVLLLTQENKLPFDVSNEQTIFYTTDEQGLRRLGRELVKYAGKGTW